MHQPGINALSKNSDPPK